MLELFKATIRWIGQQTPWIGTIVVTAVLGHYGFVPPEVQVGIYTGIVAGLAVREG